MNVKEMVEYLMCMYGKFDSIETENISCSDSIKFTAKRGKYKYSDIMGSLDNENYIKYWLDRFISEFDAVFNNYRNIKITNEDWSKTNPYLNFNRNTTIKDVIFKKPATIVFWTDGTKTVVKCQNDDVFDPEKGLAMAIAKKAFGNKGNYCNEIKKWTEKYVKPDDVKETIEINFDGKTILLEAIDNIKEHFDKEF